MRPHQDGETQLPDDEQENHRPALHELLQFKLTVCWGRPEAGVQWAGDWADAVQRRGSAPRPNEPLVGLQSLRQASVAEYATEQRQRRRTHKEDVALRTRGGIRSSHQRRQQRQALRVRPTPRGQRSADSLTPSRTCSGPAISMEGCGALTALVAQCRSFSAWPAAMPPKWNSSTEGRIQGMLLRQDSRKASSCMAQGLT